MQRRHFRLWLFPGVPQTGESQRFAFVLEVAMQAIMFRLPANKGTVILALLLMPGTILQFFAGGGMSMVDGLAPEWRTHLAFALGFLLNTVLTYACCLLVAKVAETVRPELRS